MFGMNDLRASLEMAGPNVYCPVRGCKTQVPIQRGTFEAAPRYFCPTHRIFIGRTTFEYADEADNLLWTSAPDLERLDKARLGKRESRMKRERSEDAVTWNVFRHLEATDRVSDWLAAVVGPTDPNPKVHYWSTETATGKTWQPLATARAAFNEKQDKGSEPDLIVSTDSTDIWIEAKLGSNNKTHPSDPSGACERYTQGASHWYREVLRSSFGTIAVDHHRYELLRLWLLGSWAAHNRGRKFVLVNLVRETTEVDAPTFAATHFCLGAKRQFHRSTWESLAAVVAGLSGHESDTAKLLEYFRTKTLGYSATGKLLKAFTFG